MSSCTCHPLCVSSCAKSQDAGRRAQGAGRRVHHAFWMLRLCFAPRSMTWPCSCCLPKGQQPIAVVRVLLVTRLDLSRQTDGGVVYQGIKLVETIDASQAVTLRVSSCACHPARSRRARGAGSMPLDAATVLRAAQHDDDHPRDPIFAILSGHKYLPIGHCAIILNAFDEEDHDRDGRPLD